MTVLNSTRVTRLGFLFRLAVLGASFLACSHAIAADAPPATEPVTAPRHAPPETEQWDLASEDGARSYRILVHRPSSDPPPGGFTVLTMLDGNAMFGAFTDAVRSMRYDRPDKAGLLLVAVGYPSDTPYDIPRRGFDLTPVPGPNNSYAKRPGANQGGREQFLAFLLDRLRPEVARRYPVNAQRQALFGHSLGGIFALNALYQRPDAFQGVVAASPAVWWNGQSILADERAFVRRLQGIEGGVPLQSSLRILVGGREQLPMVEDAKALAGRMAALSAHGLRSSLRVLEFESHMSVPAAAATDVVRFIYDLPVE